MNLVFILKILKSDDLDLQIGEMGNSSDKPCTQTNCMHCNCIVTHSLESSSPRSASACSIDAWNSQVFLQIVSALLHCSIRTFWVCTSCIKDSLYSWCSSSTESAGSAGFSKGTMGKGGLSFWNSPTTYHSFGCHWNYCYSCRWGHTIFLNCSHQ